MRLIFLLLLVLPIGLSAQSRKSKKSYAKGTLYGSIGFNRNAYSKSTIYYSGPGYDFNMSKTKAEDSPMGFANAFNSPLKNQYNFDLGYYINSNWALNLGIDHQKYQLLQGSAALLNGTINPGTDTVSNLNGDYSNSIFVIDTATFNYRNQGVSNIRFSIFRTDQWYAFGKKDWLAFSSILGLNLGAIATKNDFTFAGKKDIGTNSLSGFSASATVGMRFEFFRHLFVQTSGTGGYMQQFRVATRNSEPNAMIKQKFAYATFETSIGFFLYVRPTNSCNSCPHW